MNGAVTQDAVQELRHVPDLLADSVAIHHVHNAPGRAGELIHNTTPDPLMTRDINQVQIWFPLHLPGEHAVDHGGVGLHRLPNNQLRQQGRLPSITRSTDQNI